jgi:DNA-directed RNA polymerase specialized sigma24 family protein
MEKAASPDASGQALRVQAALERNHKRLWAICYRMTGLRADADELEPEAATRAIERSAQATGEDPTGWLLRLTTRLCIDHLRQKKIERRASELIDPCAGSEWVITARLVADALRVESAFRQALERAAQGP